jgi:hypothetical protein
MTDHPALFPVIRGKLRGGAADRVIAALAAVQHDIVGRLQLLASGVSEAAIEHRLASGRLRPIYRGVYTVRHGGLSADG